MDAMVSMISLESKQQQVTLALMKEVSNFESFNEFLQFVNTRTHLQLIKIYLSYKLLNFCGHSETLILNL